MRNPALGHSFFGQVENFSALSVINEFKKVLEGSEELFDWEENVCVTKISIKESATY